MSSSALFSTLIRRLVSIGFGHGFGKKFLAKLWRFGVGIDPVEIIYHGAKFEIYPLGNTIESKMLFSSRLREKEELEYIKNAISPGGAVLDIGANIGFYSIMSASFGSEKVIAVEPMPQVIQRFRKNISLNKFENIINLVEKGIGDGETETATLFVSQQDLGGSSLIATREDSERIDITLTSIPMLVKEYSVDKIDVLKIDIEGFEDKALIYFFDRVPVSTYPKILILEENSESWTLDLLSHLKALGYQCVKKTRGNSIFELN